MFKTEFYILSNAKKTPSFIKVFGWGEVFEAPDKSLIELRFDKRGSHWYITEATTGLKVQGMCCTRAEAIKACTPDLLQDISKRLKDRDMLKYAEKLADYILTAG